MQRIVIVGTGVAGASAAQALRAGGYGGEVTMVGSEPGLPYRRTMVSKELLSGAASPARALLKPAAFWADSAVTVLDERRVTAIDVAARTVATDAGQTLGYDALLLATGGRPRELAITAAGDPGVHYLRTMRDATALRESLDSARSVLIVGAGLIGCEVAAAAVTGPSSAGPSSEGASSEGAEAGGPAVTVLEAGDRVMERVLPAQVSALFADLHAERGVDLQTGVRLVDIARGPDGLVATAQDGRAWTADAVVVAVGMAPNTQLAEAAGLEVADGVLVDEFCATSAPGVYAAGDIARLPNPVLGGTHRVEHWSHAQAHGEAAARSMLRQLAGEVSADPYREVPWCWTNQYGKNVQIAGWPGAAQDWAVDGSVEARDFTALATRAGALIGAVSLGRPKDVRAARAEIAAAGLGLAGLGLAGLGL